MFLDYRHWEFLCFVFTVVVRSEKFSGSTRTWGHYQTGATLNYNTFAVGTLSGYMSSWDSSHRLCTCWPELKVQQDSPPLLQSQGRVWPVRWDLSPRSGLWLVWVSTPICLSQARSRPQNTGTALVPAQLLSCKAVCNPPSGSHGWFVFLDPQPNKAWKRYFLFLN